MGFECSGHTGYAKFGKDILCAAISGITQSCMIGLQQVLDIEVSIDRNDDNGYLKVELPSNLDEAKLHSAQVLLKTLKLSIEDLCEGYSKYISMEVIENDY